MPNNASSQMEHALESEFSNGLQYEQIDSNQYLFKSSNFRIEFFSILKESLDTGYFSDVVLRFRESDESIRAHKIVLCSASPYFR